VVAVPLKVFRILQPKQRDDYLYRIPISIIPSGPVNVLVPVVQSAHSQLPSLGRVVVPMPTLPAVSVIAESPRCRVIGPLGNPVLLPDQWRAAARQRWFARYPLLTTAALPGFTGLATTTRSARMVPLHPGLL